MQSRKYITLAVLTFLSSCLGLVEGTQGGRPECVLSPGFSTARVTKLAILVHDPDGTCPEAARRRIEDAAIGPLLRGGYAIASRSDVERVLEELKFQSSSGLTEANAAKFGKMLNVSSVLVLSVTELNRERRTQRYSWDPSDVSRAAVSARLLGVETAEILWHGQASGAAATSDSYGVASELAKRIMDEFPPRQ